MGDSDTERETVAIVAEHGEARVDGVPSGKEIEVTMSAGAAMWQGTLTLAEAEALAGIEPASTVFGELRLIRSATETN